MASSDKSDLESGEAMTTALLRTLRVGDQVRIKREWDDGGRWVRVDAVSTCVWLKRCGSPAIQATSDDWEDVSKSLAVSAVFPVWHVGDMWIADSEEGELLNDDASVAEDGGPTISMWPDNEFWGHAMWCGGTHHATATHWRRGSS